MVSMLPKILDGFSPVTRLRILEVLSDGVVFEKLRCIATPHIELVETVEKICSVPRPGSSSDLHCVALRSHGGPKITNP